MQSLRKLIQRWQRESVGARDPSSAESVRRTFAELGSVATLDVVSMYEAIGGMDAMDDEYWRLWPLSEVVSEYQHRAGFGLLFSDYLLSSWSYRLKPTSAEVSAVYVDHFDGTSPVLMASSLEEFFDRYLANPNFLHGTPSSNSRGA
jgi:hypothetical protein